MAKRRIAIGADHAGFDVKESIKKQLADLGYEVHDLGTTNTDSVDYPDYSRAVAEAVASGRDDQGVLVCGSGIGMSIAANKVPGTRAALVWNEETARLSRSHNDANVLVIGSRVIPEASIAPIVDTFMNTEFAGGRHQGRVDKITELDRLRGETAK